MTRDAHGHLLDIQGRPADTPDHRRCRCSHKSTAHGLDRAGRFTCYGSTVCGCQEMRPDDRSEK